MDWNISRNTSRIEICRDDIFLESCFTNISIIRGWAQDLYVNLSTGYRQRTLVGSYHIANADPAEISVRLDDYTRKVSAVDPWKRWEAKIKVSEYSSVQHRWVEHRDRNLRAFPIDRIETNSDNLNGSNILLEPKRFAYLD
jgi:hypothetical protein